MKRSCSFRFSLPWVLCVLGSIGCASRGVYVDARSYAPTQAPPPSQPEIVRPGDQISILVFGQDGLSSRSIRVGPRGTVMLPLLGEVPVANKQPATLASELEGALAAYVTTPHVTVIIEMSPVVITLIGETNNNSRIEMQAPVRIVDALAQAGGVSEFGDKSGIYVLRGERRIRFDYDDIIRGEKHAREFLMMTGDVLVVED